MEGEGECVCVCVCVCRGRMNCSIHIWINNPGTLISRSFTTRPGADIMSPGLVQDGTQCGEGMVRYCISCCHGNVTYYDIILLIFYAALLPAKLYSSQSTQLRSSLQ